MPNLWYNYQCDVILRVILYDERLLFLSKEKIGFHLLCIWPTVYLLSNKSWPTGKILCVWMCNIPRNLRCLLGPIRFFLNWIFKVPTHIIWDIIIINVNHTISWYPVTSLILYLQLITATVTLNYSLLSFLFVILDLCLDIKKTHKAQFFKLVCLLNYPCWQ